MRNVKVYQIFYNEETREQLDPFFIPLDNTENPRPDWFEYWPIRNILLNEKFQDDDYIGFFSPKFFLKTGRSGAEVAKFVYFSKSEVISYSPFLGHSAIFFNPFEQACVVHSPDFLEVSQNFFDYIGFDIDLTKMVSDQTTTVYSNFFVARYSFFKKWFVLAEKLFDLCEHQDHPLAKRLNAPVFYSVGQHVSQIPFRVFLLERLITVLLESENVVAQVDIDFKRAPLGVRGLDASDFEAVVFCDALKGQFKRTGNFIFVDCYKDLRKILLDKAMSGGFVQN